MVTITEPAQGFLQELLAKQDDDVVGIRVFISSPGTSKAETCIAYCREGDIKENDERKEYEQLTAFFDAPSLPFLKDAVVDYAKDRMGGQLTIKAPNAKMPQVNPDSPIEDRINYVIYYEINPMLASHGGEVSLIAVTEEKVALLNFGGGCQGCSAVELTLKQGVEKTLMDKIPELIGVEDQTDHSDTSSAYFR